MVDVGNDDDVSGFLLGLATWRVAQVVSGSQTFTTEGIAQQAIPYLPLVAFYDMQANTRYDSID